jgi:hypothetical protein
MLLVSVRLLLWFIINALLDFPFFFIRFDFRVFLLLHLFTFLLYVFLIILLMFFLMENILHRPICLVDILRDKKTHEIDVIY